MPTYDAELRDTAEYRDDLLEAEIRGLERQLTWAMRDKDVKDASAVGVSAWWRKVMAPGSARLWKIVFDESLNFGSHPPRSVKSLKNSCIDRLVYRVSSRKFTGGDKLRNIISILDYSITVDDIATMVNEWVLPRIEETGVVIPPPWASTRDIDKQNPVIPPLRVKHGVIHDDV